MRQYLFLMDYPAERATFLTELSSAAAETWHRKPEPSPLRPLGGYVRFEYDSGRFLAT